MAKAAAKQGDKVIATDVHIVLVPSPGGPVPTPTPFSFVGTIQSGCSSDVFIEGKPVATVDSVAINQQPHIPTIGTFQKPPTNQGKVIAGSTGVFINGKPAARHGDVAITCYDPCDAPVGQVGAIGTVFVGETGTGSPKPKKNAQTKEQKIIKASLGQYGKIVNARWEKNRAKCGDEIAMLTEVTGFSDGTEARFTVWQEDENGEGNHITDIVSKVQGSQAKANWIYSPEKIEEKLQTEAKEEGNEPKYYFSVDIEGEEAKSNELTFTYPLDIILSDEQGHPLDNVNYLITFSDGSKKKGTFKAGHALIEDAPYGCYTIELDDFEFILDK